MNDNKSKNLRNDLFEKRFALAMAKMQNHQGDNQNEIEIAKTQLEQKRKELRKQMLEDYQKQQSLQELNKPTKRKR